ncbi:MAG TPA: class I SAM-dependent methyltransferase, partial [Kofleriaceae bacterium]|nr:class I SAM-dependent methyltransferase [Kofleriaceae bacterium]
VGEAAGGEGQACRLIHGAGDGLPGLSADLYPPFAVVHAYGRALLPLGRQLAEALRAYAGCRGAVVKLRSRGAAGRQQVASAVVGEAAPEKLVVREGTLRFEVHPTGGLNVGLFTDMREHRRRLGELAAGRAVLNGFAYTGSISVACARGGATRVTSVDLSSGVLRWAADNLRLNGVDPDAAHLTGQAADVGRFLTDAERGGQRWDLVILDPPTFSAARGAPFSIERDYPQLVARACAVIGAGGLLWLAANTRGVALADIARAGLRRARRDAAVLETGGLPADHPTLPAQPDDRYLSTCLLRLS